MEVEPEIADMDVDLVPPIPLTRAGRPRRNYRIPRRFDDYLPESALPTESELEMGAVERAIDIVKDGFVTIANSFGIWRDYPRRPTRDPDASLSLSDLAENPAKDNLTSHSASHSTIAPEPRDSPDKAYWPFSNMTIHRVMQWLNNGNTIKSEAQVNDFVHKVVLAPDFSQEHLLGFDAHRENIRLDKSLANSSFHQQFKESTVDILVPSGTVGIPPKTFSLLPGLLHRKLTTVISDAFTGPLSHFFHFSPFMLYHKSPITAKEERIFGEIYTSDAFLAEHENVQQNSLLPPNDPDCKREKTVAALMFSSDATHLTNFGSAKAWPIYLMLGNLSKYFRAQPNLGALYHLAYIPSASTHPDLKLWYKHLPIYPFFCSCQIHSRILLRHSIASGGLKNNLFSLIVGASSCMARGVYYLMMISSTHVPMELLSCVSMELSDGSTQGFLHIQLIIQKSLCYLHSSWFYIHFIN